NPMDVGADRGLARVRVTRQLESSLDRLGVNQVDVYLAHAFDPETPLEETVGTFDGLQQLGLIKTWGVSNFDAGELRSLFELAQPAVTAVVIGPRRVEHLEPAVAALQVALSREESDQLAELF